MKYRKKPIVIEAMQYRPETFNDVFEFAGLGDEDSGKPYAMQTGYNHNEGVIIIPTLEGDMTAHEGDYIIKGIKGEFYPCKADIFEATYDAV